MATFRGVPQPEWRGYFDRISKALPGRLAEVEVAGLDLGDQIAVEWVPLLGITYESRDDLLDVAFDRANHLIRHPQEILVEEDAGRLLSVAVIDGEGIRRIVRLRQPLMLPPAHVAAAASRE
jgi:hypothetical protein